MAKKISNKDLFEGDLFQPTIDNVKTLLEGVKGLKTELKNLAKINKQTVSGAGVGGMRAKDLKALDKAQLSVVQNAKAMQEVQKNEVKLEAILKGKTDALAKSKINLSKATKQQKDNIRDLIILGDKEAGTLEKLQARNRQLRREREKLNLGTEKGRIRLKQINRELDKNNAKIKANSDVMKKQRLNVGNYTQSIKQAAASSGLFGGVLFKLTSIQEALTALTKKDNITKEISTANTFRQIVAEKSLTRARRAGLVAQKALNLAMKASITGVILVALGGLIATFSRTQKNVDKLSDAMSAMGAILDVLIDRLSQTGDGIILIFTSLSDLIPNILTRIQIQLLTFKKFLIDTLSFTIPNPLGEDFVVGMKDAEERSKKTQEEIDALNDQLSKTPEFKEGLDSIANAFKGIGDEIEREIKLASQFNAERRELARNQKLLNAEIAVETTRNKENQTFVRNKLNDDRERLAVLDEIAESEIRLTNKKLKLAEKDLALSVDITRLSGEHLAFINQIRTGQIKANEAIAKAEKLTLSSKAGEESLFKIIEKVVALEEERQKLAEKQTKFAKQRSAIEKEIATKQAKALLVVSQNELKLAKQLERSDEDRIISLEKFEKKGIESFKTQLDANIITQEEFNARVLQLRLQRADEEEKILQRQIRSEDELLKFRQSVDVQKASERVEDLKKEEASNDVIIDAIHKRLEEEIEAEIQSANIKLQNEQLTANEIVKINEERDEKIRRLKKKANDEELALNKKKIEEEKKQESERFKRLGEFVDGLAERQRRASEERTKQLDEEVDKSREREKELRDIARQGILDANENLSFERKKQLELQKEKEREEARQRKRELGFKALGIYTAKLEAGDENALINTIKDVSLLFSAFDNLASAFEGTEDTGGAGNLDDKGGKLWMLHPHERVMTREQNEKVGELSNDELSNIALRYRTGELFEATSPSIQLVKQPYESNAQFLSKIDELKASIDKLPHNMPQQDYYYDEFSKAMVHVSKAQNKVVRNHHKQGGIWG